MLPNYNKVLQQLMVLHTHHTFKHRTQTNSTSPKNFLKVLQLNANGICSKTDKIQLLIVDQSDRKCKQVVTSA